jgi:flagellar protein FliS
MTNQTLHPERAEVPATAEGTLAALLRDGAERIRAAREHWHAGAATDARESLSGALDVLTETGEALDPNLNDLAAELDALLNFASWELVEANRASDSGRLEPIQDMLLDLAQLLEQAATEPGEPESASPQDLVVRLVARCRDNIRWAREYAAQGDVVSARERLQWAQAILAELDNTLDHSRDDELVERLDALYTYMIGEVLTANRDQDFERLQTVEDILDKLYTGWRQAAHAVGEGQAEAEPAAEPAPADVAPEDMVVLLVEGALRQVRRSRQLWQAHQPVAAREALMQALDIVIELDNSLERDVGGELVDQLDALYAYMTREMVQANLNGELDTRLEPVESVLATLGAGWEDAAREVKEDRQADTRVRATA